MVVREALGVLRIPESPAVIQVVMRHFSKLIRHGFTAEDALTVARWARRQIDAGDRDRFLTRLTLMWAPSYFPENLAAPGRTSGAPTSRRRGSDKPFRPVSYQPDVQRDRDVDYQIHCFVRGLTSRDVLDREMARLGVPGDEVERRIILKRGA